MTRRSERKALLGFYREKSIYHRGEGGYRPSQREIDDLRERKREVRRRSSAQQRGRASVSHLSFRWLK